MPEFPIEDWVNAGGNPEAQVPMAVRWNVYLEAFEFTSLDGSYFANVTDWNRYLTEHDSDMIEFDGPIPGAGDDPTGELTGETQKWWRVRGPAAKQMHESARTRREEAERDGETGRILEAGMVAGTVWKMDEDRFYFRPMNGRALTPIEKVRWQEAASEEGSSFAVREDAERGGEIYVVGPPFSWSLMKIADGDKFARRLEDSPAYNAMTSLLMLGDQRTFVDENIVAEDARQVFMGDDPKWEGSPSFSLCLDSTGWIIGKYHGETGLIEGAQAVAADGRSGMVRAHPIVITPEQVEVLPMPTLTEAVEFVNKCQLPFDPLFLDLTSGPSTRQMSFLSEGPAVEGLVGPGLESHGGAMIGMAGAMFGVDERTTRKLCIPFGSVVVPNDEEYARTVAEQTGAEVTGDLGRDWGFCLSDPANNGMPSHAPIAAVMLDPALSEESGYDDFGVRIDPALGPVPLSELDQHEPRDIALPYVGAPAFGGPKGAAALLAVPDVMSFAEYGADIRRRKMRGWAAMAFLHFRRAVAVLMFLDSYNVEIVEAKLTRQVRRQAERKGIPISKTVYIRHRVQRNGSRHDYDPNAPREVGLTHQFEVQGNQHHVQKGSHVWCKTCKGEGRLEGPLLPDASDNFKECEVCEGTGLDRAKLTPCVRRDQDGNLTCPNGCRKEWVPPFVKGDPDSPLVPKTRKT